MNVCALHCSARSFGSHRTSRLAVLCDATLDNSRSFYNPLVRRLDSDSREIVIRHHVSRNSTSCSDDCGDRTLHATCPLFIAAELSRSSMCSFIRVSTARTATLIAFLIARGGELP